MVDRTSAPREIKPTGTPQVSRTAPGSVGVKSTAGAFSGHTANPRALLGGTIMDSPHSALVQNIIGKLSGLAETHVELNRQRAYLDGALAVGAGMAEEELGGNILTRDWKKAGHRDYSARLAALEYESGLARDLNEDREMSPSDYARKLAERRKALLPTLEGMSGQAREKMFNQLLTAESAALQKQTAAHRDFIIEQKMKIKSQELQSGIAEMLTLTPNSPEYRAKLGEVYTKVVQDVWNAPDLPEGNKHQMIVEVATHALNEGDFGLYNAITNNPIIEMPNGDRASIAQLIPMEDRLKLNAPYKSARNRYQMRMHADFWALDQSVQTTLAAGEVPDLSAQEYFEVLEQQGYMGNLTPSEIQTKRNSFVRAYKKNSEAADNVNAYVTGNFQKMLAQGGVGETAKAVTKTLAGAGHPLQNILGVHLGVWSEHGLQGALDEGGKIIRLGIESAMYADPEDGLSEQAQAVFSAAMEIATSPESTVSLGTMKQAVAASAGPEAAEFMNTFTSIVKVRGITDSAQAVRETQREILRRTKLSDTEKAAQRKKLEKAAAETMEWLDNDRKWYDADILGILRSNVGRATQPLQARKELLRHNGAQIEWQQIVRSAASEQVTELANSGVAFTPEEVANYVSGNLAGRVLTMKHNKVLLPDGLDLHAEYGIDAGYEPREVLSEALDLIIKPEHGGTRIVVEYVDGGFRMQEYSDRTAAPTRALNYTQEDVRDAVQRVKLSEQRKAQRLYGDGIEYGSDSGKVRINGMNSAGFQPEDVLALRKSVVDHEGVRFTPYSDGGGKSVGVGINTGHPAYEQFFGGLGDSGIASPETVAQSFATVSDSFLHEVKGFLKPVPDNYDFQKYLTLTYHQLYQTGKPKLAKSDSFAAMNQAIAAGDTQIALAQLRRTPAYKAAGRDRRKFYEDLVQGIIK